MNENTRKYKITELAEKERRKYQQIFTLISRSIKHEITFSFFQKYDFYLHTTRSILTLKYPKHSDKYWAIEKHFLGKNATRWNHLITWRFWGVVYFDLIGSKFQKLKLKCTYFQLNTFRYTITNISCRYSHQLYKAYYDLAWFSFYTNTNSIKSFIFDFLKGNWNFETVKWLIRIQPKDRRWLTNTFPSAISGCPSLASLFSIQFVSQL
jgi:hypothetical protein